MEIISKSYLSSLAITRAEENLYISSPVSKYGKKVSKSRFIDDIKCPTKQEMDSIGIGDKIYHKKFREGIIVEKNANIVKIKFADGERSLDYKVCMVKNIIWKI